MIEPASPQSAWRGRRVTLLGLGTHGGGIGAARYLARQGARVTISDRASLTQLAAPRAALEAESIEAWHSGELAPADALAADLLVVNPAVLPTHPAVVARRQAGLPISSEIELFLNATPAMTIVGVTGSNGKSSTAAMLHSILVAAGRSAWLGGNIGGSLLDDLPRQRTSDVIVFELSSFQLAGLNDSARWPDAAILTNLSPNHLDWHGSFDAYRQAKLRLIEHLPRRGAFVIGAADLAGTLAHHAPRPLWPSEQIPPLRVVGKHQRLNGACAATMAEALGVPEPFIQAGLRAFVGLPHRLREVAQIDGRRVFNDSKATSPAATCAAIEAVEGPLWLIVGGVGKGTEFDTLARVSTVRSRGIVCFGAAAEALSTACQQAGGGRVPIGRVATLAEAWAWCWSRAEAGDTILFAPGCASFDQYRDYIERGEAFERLVQQSSGCITHARP